MRTSDDRAARQRRIERGECVCRDGLGPWPVGGPWGDGPAPWADTDCPVHGHYREALPPIGWAPSLPVCICPNTAFTDPIDPLCPLHGEPEYDPDAVWYDRQIEMLDHDGSDG